MDEFKIYLSINGKKITPIYLIHLSNMFLRSSD